MANQVMSLAAYGCDEVTRPQLSGVVLPPATKSYQPIGHDYLVDIVEDCIGDVGFRFGPQHHGLSHDGARYFGLIELMGETSNTDYVMLLGIRNSLDKRFPAGVAFGMQVMVCANLCFGGEQYFGRKHTPNIMRDLPGLVAATVSNTKQMQHNQALRVEKYADTPLSDRDADHLILNLLRRKAVNATRIPKLVQEWDEPSHDFGGRTVWRLFNAATETLKGVNIHEMPKRTIELQAVCDEVSEFMPIAAAA